MFESIGRDVRTVLRGLSKARAFAIVTILTLAVAIGANTAIFSVVDGVLLRPLPYPDPDGIVTVAARTLPQAGGKGEAPFSDRGFWHFVKNNRSFKYFGGYSEGIEWPLTGIGQPIQADVATMTVPAFEVLGVHPLRGRLPTAAEDVPNGSRLALVSEDLWKSVFGGDPGMVGRTIELNGAPFQVIGIMPHGYNFPSPETDIWVPFQLNPASPNFGGHHIDGIARLAPGATIASAQKDAESLIARFSEVGYGPQWFKGVFSGKADVHTLKEQLVGSSRRPLLILLGTMGFVLLIACSNVANLFLVRAEARSRETAVRLALGSGRRRLVQLVLTESILLGLLGGAAGLALAYVGIKLLILAAPPSIPRLGEIGIHASVLAFTAAVSVIAGLLFGLLPALRTTSPQVVASLRGGAGSNLLGRHGRHARNVLVTAQVALALVLFVGSALMVRSFSELRAVNPGFRSDGLLTFRISPAPIRYHNDPVAVERFYEQLLGKLRTLPSVKAAGAINTLPLTPGGATLTTQIDEFPPATGDFPPIFLVRRATPSYFETMGIPIVEGRAFTTDDSDRRLGSLIISKSIKDKYWPHTSALGKRMTTAGAPARVVGVVGDVHHAGLDTPAELFVYKPMLDSVGGGVLRMTLAVRTDVEPLSLLPTIRGVVHSLDPNLPITDIKPMDVVVGDSLSRTSFTMTLLALAAAIALFLGAIGIYGVISYGVVQRTGEIGVRQALGAEPSAVRGLILRDGLVVAGTGIVLGLATAALMGRFIASLLYGVSPYDVVTLVGGSVVFLIVAALASAIPARRAARIPPVVALRAG